MHAVSKKKLKILGLLLCTWKVQTNQKLSRKFFETVSHPWKFQCQKLAPEEILHDFFLDHH